MSLRIVIKEDKSFSLLLNVLSLRWMKFSFLRKISDLNADISFADFLK